VGAHGGGASEAMDLDTVVQTPPVRISSRRRRSRPSHCLRVAVAFRSRAFIKSLVAGCFSGSIALAVRFTDQNLGVDIDPSLPNIAIFSAFLTFASLVAAFRTSNALNRYSSAGRFVHMMIAGWYDAASTLVSFSRASERPPEEVENFRQVIVRLVSVLSALCMTDLQSIDEDLTHRSHRFSFEVLEVDDMDQDTRELITGSTHRVEAIFQAVQSLVVDAHRSGVLSIAPPLLTRSFQELGIALRTFHEAKMIACEPIPYAYRLITSVILVLQAVCVPFMVANFATGLLGAFIFAFLGTFLVWFVNMVADTLDNPFRKEANTLELAGAQRDLNDYLVQLLANANRKSPRFAGGSRMPPRRSLSSVSDLSAPPPPGGSAVISRSISGDSVASSALDETALVEAAPSPDSANPDGGGLGEPKPAADPIESECLQPSLGAPTAATSGMDLATSAALAVTADGKRSPLQMSSLVRDTLAVGRLASVAGSVANHGGGSDGCASLSRKAPLNMVAARRALSAQRPRSSPPEAPKRAKAPQADGHVTL